MSVKSLFIIIIRILGLFILDDVIVGLLQAISVLFYNGIFDQPDFLSILSAVFFPFLFIIIAALVTYLMILKAPYIVVKLGLDKGFDQDPLSINMHRSDILQIAIIVIGGLLLVESLPMLFKSIIDYFNAKRIDNHLAKPDLGPIVYASVKVVIGYLMLYYSRLVVNYIELRRKNTGIR